MSEAQHLRSVEFWVPGAPMGKQDQKTTTHGRRKNHATGEWESFPLKFAVHYKDPRTRRAERDVKLRALVEMKRLGFEPFTGPVALVITAVFVQPESWTAKERRENAWHAEKPDGPNVLELVADAGSAPKMKKGLAALVAVKLKGVLWQDDKQLSTSAIRKIYGTREGLLVTVAELDPATLDITGSGTQGLSWPMGAGVAAATGASRQLGLVVGGET